MILLKTGRISARLFNLISWGITGIIILALGSVTAWQLIPGPVAATPQPTATASQSSIPFPLPGIAGPPSNYSITRHVELKTTLPQQKSTNLVEHTVVSGDSIFRIAQKYNLKPETVLWANFDILKDSPDSIRIGQVLKIPPVDGVYYQWEEGDTLDTVAEEFNAKATDIIDWGGNNIDLTDLKVTTGTYIMIPGGRRPFVQWVIPNVSRNNSGSNNRGSSPCNGGYVGTGAFIWPAANHYLSGNDYWEGHLGIDIADDEGGGVMAADAGVATMAQGGWNYGYGNVIMIDHGNGFITLYAHLSQLNVVPCESVYQGQLIGLSGNTGNSFGAHLHFEIRLNGVHVNPWGYLH